MIKKLKMQPFEVKTLTVADKEALLTRVDACSQSAEDSLLIRQIFDMIEILREKVERNETRVRVLLKQFFGIKSEKTEKIKEALKETDRETVAANNSDVESKPSNKISESQKPDKAKGHGRNGADAYTSAKRITIAHPELTPGGNCPECFQGKVYLQKKAGVFIQITGESPLQAAVYEMEKLRCNLCGEIFQAPLPQEIANKKAGAKHYDETAKSMIALLRYGAGLPMYRLAELQKRLGIPLPVSTQWDKISELSYHMMPVYNALIRQAAQGELFYNDDTGVKVLSLIKEIAEEVKIQKGKTKTRTGIFTTGIISVVEEQQIALYFSGRKHAGENITDLLEKRQSGLGPPIQMSDAKSGNTPKNIEVIECNCNTHARRNFVNVAEDYPDQCLYVITDIFGKIYHYDALAKQNNLSPEERLKFHQEKSGPIMNEFHHWLKKQFDEKLVEPNSSLGKAISYTLKHWKKLTCFLKVAGAPLDNNICEQMLKKAILHRKNSLFYKTEGGAQSGDLFMSLIVTCNLAGVNPFDYLTQLQIHTTLVSQKPEQWFPWNYQETIAGLSLKPLA
jgi:transposase